jgi:multiple sugar transport system substrate-binding protein
MKLLNNAREILKKLGKWNPAGLDRFLFFSALLLAVIFFTVNMVLFSDLKPARVELPVSRRGVDLFGAETMGALIREFEKEHPKLQIKLTSDVAEKTPAVLFFDEGQFGAMMRENALAPLETFFQDDGADGNKSAACYALPLVSFMDVLIYNIEILQKAGFEKPPKTRAEFLMFARAAAKAAVEEQAELYPFAIALNAGDPLALRRDIYSWVWAAGADVPLPPESGKQPEFSRTAQELIAFIGQLGREGLLAPGSFEKTGAQRLEEFAKGKIAMMIVSSADLPALRNKMDASKLGFTVIPAGLNSPLKNRSCLQALYAGLSSAAGAQKNGDTDQAAVENAFLFISFLAEKSLFLSSKVNASGGFLYEPGGAPASPVFSAGAQAAPLPAKIRDIFNASDFVENFSGNPRQPEIDALVREQLAVLIP